MKSWLYRFDENDTDGDPLDFGLVYAHTADEMIAQLRFHAATLEYEGPVKVYEVDPQSPQPGVVESGEPITVWV